MANIITTLSLEMSANWYVTKKLNSIGRVGENTVTKLIIEPTEILDNVTYEIEIMGADGSKNVAELTIDGAELYLILTANMLTTSGITKMQVRGLFTDGSIKKSNIFELKVNRSISATEHYEEYAVTIFDQLVQDCRDIIEGAESYAVRAETAATNAEAYEQSASASAQAASGYADSASGYADSAASSASSASTSATNASASATNAANSETNAAASASSASTSAANANTSVTNAANSASAAATSATNAHNSEVNASTSETNASVSATEAAASAEAIAASVAQINENTYRINDLEAIIGGYQLADLPTGAIATVTDGTALLMPSLKVGIEPVQDLHGYDHPWAGGAGKNLLPLTEDRMKEKNTSGIWNNNAYILNNLTFVIKTDESNNIIGINVNGTANDDTTFTVYDGTLNLGVQGYKTISGCPLNGSASTYCLSLFRPNSGSINDVGNGISYAYATEIRHYIFITIKSGTSLNNLLFQPMIESGNAKTTFEPYSNICSISGHTAANIIVSPTTSAEDGTTYNIQFKDGDNPLTVYGGTLDVIGGVLTVTDAHIASYNSETLPSTWISDRDVYAAGTAPTTGAEVVYKLANSVTYQLTPTQIRTLVGNNNIWADVGDIISGKYYKSPY